MAVLFECPGHLVFIDEKEDDRRPPGERRPRGAPRRHVLVDLEIHRCEDARAGFLVIATSTEPNFNDDTWHRTLAAAKEYARHGYGVADADWHADSAASDRDSGTPRI